MADINTRLIVDFFRREAPTIGITAELLNNPSSKTEELIQAYHFLCELIFEDITTEPSDDRGTEQVLARPTLIIKTREAVNTIFNGISNGNDEFCFTDLLQPDQRRTRNFMSQMIRFYNFKCDLAAEIINADNQIEEQCRTFNFESELEKKTNEQLNREKEQLLQLESTNRNVEQRELELRQELGTKKTEKQNVKKNYEAIQERMQEMEARIEGSKKKITDLEDTGRRLETNIVNSPDRLIAELKQLDTEKTNLQQKFEKTIQENKKLEKEMAEYTMTAQSVQGLAEEVQKLEAIQNTILEQRAIEEKCQQEIGELERQKKEVLQELEQFEKKFQAELAHLKDEVVSTRKEIQAIKGQRLQLENDEKEMAIRLGQVKENIRQHREMIKRTERMSIIATEKFDNSVEKALNDCDTLKNKVDEQHEALDKLIKKIMTIYEPK